MSSIGRALTWNQGRDFCRYMRRIISKLFNRFETGEDMMDLGQLTRLLRRYTVEKQQVPKDLRELVGAKYLTSLPVAPAGRRFVIDRKKVEVKLESSNGGGGAEQGPESIRRSR
jgi:hypothetical protein